MLLVALDISAAFDMVSHSTLISRLSYSFGITDSALSWLSSYLSNRSQFIALGNEKSSITTITVGVPQGSVLGPLLFTAYTSPISRLVASSGLAQQQYADDTQVYVTLSQADFSLGINSLQSGLSSLCHWFACNGLAINPDKSDAIIFSTAQRAEKLRLLGLTHINVAGNVVPISKHIKILGVTFDSTLSFSEHIQVLSRSCYFHIRALRHVRPFLTEELSNTLACSLVTSRLDYANALLYNTSEANLTKLQSIQNSLARVVMKSPFRSSSLPQIRHLHWLPIRQRIDYKVASLVHSIRETSSPPYLTDMVKNYVPSRSLRSGEVNKLDTPRSKLAMTDRAFFIAAPKVWNNLPPSLRTIPSSSIFRSKLKTYLTEIIPDS